MFYTVANEGWSPGRPLPPSAARAGLSRTPPPLGVVSTSGVPTLAVALRYDAAQGLVVAEGPAARALGVPWAAPAVVDTLGRVTVLSLIPAALVKVVGPRQLRFDPKASRAGPHLRLAPLPPSEKGLGR